LGEPDAVWIYNIFQDATDNHGDPESALTRVRS
jgi:hypothetical protein